MKMRIILLALILVGCGSDDIVMLPPDFGSTPCYESPLGIVCPPERTPEIPERLWELFDTCDVNSTHIGEPTHWVSAYHPEQGPTAPFWYVHCDTPHFAELIYEEQRIEFPYWNPQDD
jgi:hypothetical protein